MRELDMNRVAAVVVTYNRKELLEQCINRIKGQQGAQCDILIVDNASSDGTYEMVRERFGADSSVIYENTGANLGSAGGFHYGVKWAVQLGYEYLWIMDDDVWPESTALVELMKADQEMAGKWGFLSSVVLWYKDGSLCKSNIQKRSLFSFLKEKDYKQKYVPVVIASFASLYVKAEVVQKVGFPIAEYFIYTDDYEFTRRISRYAQGYVVSSSIVKHAMKRNSKADFALEEESRRYRYDYLYRNDVHCYRQCGLSGWLYIILKDIYTCFNILINSRGQKLEKIKIVIRGFREGLNFAPKIEYPDMGG